MLGRLRARLLASYAFILILTLAVIGGTLILVLGARPVPTEEVSQQLAGFLDALLQRGDLANIPPDGPAQWQMRTLNVVARTARWRGFAIRILVLRPDGSVGYDSIRLNQRGDRLTLSSQPYMPPIVPTSPSMASLVRGSLNGPDGSEWRFVAQSPDAAAPNSWIFLLALPAPRQQSLGEMLQYYGEDILIPILQAGLIGLVVAFALAFIIARSVAKPLQELARAANAVAGGQLDRRVPMNGPHEVRIVAEAFNQMTHQVAASQQAQREFLANVTHDLRTPLTSIQGFSQAIIDGVASNPAAAQRAARIIHDEAGRLNRMVEELLDLARIEAGRWNMTRHTVLPGDVLHAVGERLAPKAADRGLTLKVELMPLPPIAGDGDRLVQVFTNLTDNAIKHTPSGGTITLRAELLQQNGAIGILAQVCDTGEGIPAEDLPHIFDRFYQVDKSRQRVSREGVGLGLTITKQIVEAHGGKIWAESAEGQGTTISVWLPVPASDATTIIRRRSAAVRRSSLKLPD